MQRLAEAALHAFLMLPSYTLPWPRLGRPGDCRLASCRRASAGPTGRLYLLLSLRARDIPCRLDAVAQRVISCAPRRPGYFVTPLRAISFLCHAGLHFGAGFGRDNEAAKKPLYYGLHDASLPFHLFL